MGSRTVDFMNPLNAGPELFDHGIKNLVLRELHEIEDKFELYHDYAVNVTSFHLCDIIANKGLENFQARSPGILLIAEVEGTKGDLTARGLEASLISSLKKEGMIVISSDVAQNLNNTYVFVRMKEGYVLARAIPQEHYVGFDIHLWSSFDKQNQVKNAIISSVGGGFMPISSYRIITGGMFGVDGWMEDEKLNGPQFKDLCDMIKDTTPLVPNKNGSTSESDVFSAIRQGLRLLKKKDLNVAILVGNSYVSEKSIDGLRVSISDFVRNIKVLNCPSMSNFNRYDASANEALSSCEKRLHDVIIHDSKFELFDAIIIDSTADKVTSSILLKLLSAWPLTKILALNSIVITPSLTNHEKAWKKNFMLRLKDEVFGDNPDAAFVDIAVENKKTNSGFNVMITNYGLQNFVRSLNETIVEFNAKTKNELFSRVNILNGGAWRYQKDFEPSRVFLPDDYDQTEPLAQWKSQNPVGHQVILQLEPITTTDISVAQITESVLSEAIKGAIKEVDIGWDADSVKKFCDVGEGCLFLALFESGTLSILWDGRSHVDINIYTLKEDIDLVVDVFVQSFLEWIPTHVVTLRDEQPRGFGGVVSYGKDVSDGKLPHWAPM